MPEVGFSDHMDFRISGSAKADVAAWSMITNHLELIKELHNVLQITGD